MHFRLNFPSLHLPDIGEAKRKAMEPAARHCPNDFSMTSIPSRSTKMTGNKEAQQPESKSIKYRPNAIKL